jgi:hypothetical protein
LKIIQPGDPLVGAPEPTMSAPATRAGKRLADKLAKPNGNGKSHRANGKGVTVGGKKRAAGANRREELPLFSRKKFRARKPGQAKSQ